jgi:hypothetical protein
MINTLLGTKIDIERQRPVLGNVTGGLSGPAVRPVAVRLVYQVAQAVHIPIIGMGGIATAEDAIEFILAGASAVSVGAMNFVDPYTTVKVVEGIEDYMRTYHVENLTDLIGRWNKRTENRIRYKTAQTFIYIDISVYMEVCYCGTDQEKYTYGPGKTVHRHAVYHGRRSESSGG